MAIPILDIGCGISKDLNSALSTIDDMINDIINGIGDITGAIADAVSSALDALGTALGKMLPDISSLIPDISLSGAIEGLLGLVEGSLEYLAKLAEITLQFGQFILDSGFNLFDMIADAALAFLKGLNPCSALPIDASIGADGVAKAAPAAIGYGQVAAKKEPKKKKADYGTINKDKSVVSQADSKGRGFGFVPEGAGASTEAFISQADAQGRGFGFVPEGAGASIDCKQIMEYHQHQLRLLGVLAHPNQIYMGEEDYNLIQIVFLKTLFNHLKVQPFQPSINQNKLKILKYQ